MDSETEKFILSYSSGSRAASRIVDQHRVQGLICIGYPFRKPGSGDEPDRYRHLCSLHTSTLILQGRYDEYGGDGEMGEYPLSGKIKVEFLDSDHAYRLEDGDWDAVVDRIVRMVQGSEAKSCALSATLIDVPLQVRNGLRRELRGAPLYTTASRLPRLLEVRE